jgi:hypothetical protein
VEHFAFFRFMQIMRNTLRRQRTLDPLASPTAVREICNRLRERMPDVIPNKEEELLRFLYAVRHVERRPTTDPRRGRPGRWTRLDLISAAGYLRAILERETRGRVSLSSFIGQYLQVLLFPADILEALGKGDINLSEAAYLARLSAKQLGCSPSEALIQRRDILQSHLAMQGSQTRLRARVNDILSGPSTSEVISEGLASAVVMTDELLEIDAQDTRHMFWEEMKRIFFAMRTIKPEDIDDETMDEFAVAIDQISSVLHRIEKRRRKREELSQKPSAKDVSFRV